MLGPRGTPLFFYLLLLVVRATCWVFRSFERSATSRHRVDGCRFGYGVRGRWYEFDDHIVTDGESTYSIRYNRNTYSIRYNLIVKLILMRVKTFHIWPLTVFISIGQWISLGLFTRPFWTRLVVSNRKCLGMISLWGNTFKTNHALQEYCFIMYILQRKYGSS